MNGWRGILLRVNLTAGTVWKETLQQEYLCQVIGQRGLAIRYYEEVCTAEDKVVLMTGPLTGLFGACTNQFSAAFSTGAAGKMGVFSTGGQFGSELKLAGYDGLILEGRSQKPVYLLIEDECAELRSAEQIWGRDVEFSYSYLTKHGAQRRSAIYISPAGEQENPLASVLNDSYNTESAGAGAAFGRMGLKGIAVSGTGAISMARPSAYLDGALEDRSKLISHPVSVALGGDKPQCMVPLLRTLTPFSETKLEKLKPAWDSAQAKQCRTVRRNACYSCPIGCRAILQTENGQKGLLPDYRDGWAFGRYCGLERFSDVLQANWLCKAYGVAPVACSRIAGARLGMENGETEKGAAERRGQADLEAVLDEIRRVAGEKGPNHPVLQEEMANSLDTRHSENIVAELLELSGICPMAGPAMTLAQLSRRLSDATGEPFSEKRLLEIRDVVKQMEQHIQS